MTIYETIKALNPEDFSKLLKCGILKSNTLVHIEAYEAFNKFVGEGITKMQAYEETADLYDFSSDMVIKIVKRMNTKL